MMIACLEIISFQAYTVVTELKQSTELSNVTLVFDDHNPKHIILNLHNYKLQILNC